MIENRKYFTAIQIKKKIIINFKIKVKITVWKKQFHSANHFFKQ